MKVTTKNGPGYCYVAPSLPNSCFLGHVSGPLFCLFVKIFASLVYASLVYSIVNHSNPETPEQPVNRTNLVVLDIECFENNMVKELGGYKDGQTLGYSFLPPKKF